MPAWLDRFLRRGSSDEGNTDAGDDAQMPPWAEELAGAVQRAARVVAKTGLRVEDVERKIEGGFAELRGAIERAKPVAAPGAQRWDDLLDALDMIEEAVHALGPDDPTGLRDGLRGVVGRIERFLGQAGLERVSRVTGAPDGRLFKVVGTSDMADGSGDGETRVLRAAVLDQGRVLREGEILTARRPS